MPADIFDQVAPDQQQSGDIFDQVATQPAQAPQPQTKPEGFLESLGHTFGIGKEEAEQRRQNLEQHPVRSILEDLPPVQAAEGLYQGGKRIAGELGQAYDAAKEGNTPGAAAHAIQAIPFVGAGIQRGAEQLPAQQGIQNPLQPNVLGTVVGTAAQAAPAALGGYEGLRNGLRARLAQGRAPATMPTAQTAAVPTPAPVPEAVAPEQPGGPTAPSGGPAPQTPGPRAPAAEPVGGGALQPKPAGPATQGADVGKPTITLEQNPPQTSSLLDDVVRQTEVTNKLREKLANMSPDDLKALQKKFEAMGYKLHAAGDMEGAKNAAHADIAVSDLLNDVVNATNEAGRAPQAGSLGANADELAQAGAALSGASPEEIAATRAQTAPTMAPDQLDTLAQQTLAAVAETGKQKKGDIFDQVAGQSEGRPVIQGSDKPKEIQQSAQEQKPVMQQMTQAATQGVPGAKVEGVRVKDAESVENKDERGKAPETITDHLGGRVSAPTPEAVQQVQQNIEQNLPVTAKDQIDSNGLKATQYAVQTGKPGEPNQQSEIQVVTSDQAKAMKDTDELYDKQKEALARGDQAEADRIGDQIKARFERAKLDQQFEKHGIVNQRPPEEQQKLDDKDVESQKESKKNLLRHLGPETARAYADANPEAKSFLDEIFPPEPASKENSNENQPRENQGTPAAGPQHGSGASGASAQPPAPGSGGGERGLHEGVQPRSPESAAAGGTGTGTDQPAVTLPEILTKGTRVQLQDGRTGTVQFYDRAKGFARIKRDDGKEMPMVPRKALSPAPAAAPSSEGKKDEVTPQAKGDKWIGVDLDGTLAKYDGFKGATVIGAPIPAMVERVKRWIAEGNNVKILSARVAEDKDEKTREAIQDWTEKHIGKRLEVTDRKDHHMVALYDDRAVGVERNTGELLSQPQPEEHNAQSGNGGSPSAAPNTKGEGSKDDANNVKSAVSIHAHDNREKENGSGESTGVYRLNAKPEQPAGESAKPASEAKGPLGGENGKQGTQANAANEVGKPKNWKDAVKAKKSATPQVAPMAGMSPLGAKPEEKEHKYKFGNTQHNIAPDSDAAKAIDEVRAKIPEADLAGDGKDIGDNHVTVRYGIQGEDTAGIKAFIEQQEPFDAKLGPVASFPPSEHSDGAAPLIAPVESPDLHRINEEIEKHGDFIEPNFPEYKPHATIAYVKPEAADKYTGDKTTDGATFRVDSIDITDRDGNAETVALKGKPEDNKEDERPTQPASEHPAGGGRKTADTGSRDRTGVESAPEGDGAHPPGEGNTGGANQGKSPRLRSSSGRRAKPRTEPGSGQGANESLDNSPGLEPVEEAEQQATKRTKRNKDWFHHPEDWHPPAGALTRLDNNIAALEILRDVQKNPRKLTDDEKTKLANYVGWGALSRVFDEEYLKPSHEEENPDSYGDREGYDYNRRRYVSARKETPAYRAERERWRAANKKLRDLLTPEEYQEATDSTVNAHYTSPELVRFMWDAVKRMGFKSGNVMEPSGGVGNFLGMMPEEIRSKVQAIANDKDTVSAGIMRLLYPEAAVFNKPFEDLILPNNEMDLAISNVPFLDVTPYDKNYPKLKAMLHDYFFVKSLDKVKPGGVVAFITSTGTMDRQDSRIRELLAGQADLVAAYRLPSTAFKANAGTDVTTDLIILRKRLPGEEPAGEAWTKTVKTKIPVENERRMHELPLNEYYEKHPENMFGKAVASKKMYNNLRFTLNKPDRPIEELLKDALERIPKNIIKTAPRPTSASQQETEAVFAADETLEYSYQIDDKGNIRQKREGKLVKAQAVLDKNGLPKPATVDRVKAMIRLRQSLNDLMYAMKTMADDEDSNAQIKVLREDLEKKYDAFVKKYGLLNSTGNYVFREDPHYPRLLALEHYDKAHKTGVKADIFHKRTIFPRESLRGISNDPQEALQQILAHRGYPDIELMAQLQGKTPAEAAKALVEKGVLFRDPITGEYATKEKYLSGYVRTKLDDARKAVEQGQKEYQRNVDELEKVQPEDLHITDDPETSISVRLGGTWIPMGALEDFFEDTFKTKGTFEYKDGSWSVEAQGSSPEIRNQWATQRANAVQLLQDSLNLKQTSIFDTNPDGSRSFNPDASTAARSMQEQIRQEFQRWALGSDKWRAPLEKAYNYAFNNLVEQEYDGSFLTFPGMNPEIKLKPHQVNAVWRMIQDGRALLAHEVGAGKTFEMVAAAMEGKRTGVFKKPMIAVPNHIVDQFRKEFLLLYPGANILVPSEKDFDAKNRQRIMSQIATGDYDAIILPHSQFNLMDISPERQKKTIQSQMDELDESLRAAIEEDPEFHGMTIEEAEAKIERDEAKGGKRKRASTVKELVKSRLKFKERLKELSDLAADKAINFDDTGVDALFVDEAHTYKNLKFFTKMERVAGLQQANAKSAFRILAKIQYLQEVNNGRGVFFATGTPVQNTMAELYTMMKYVAPDVLERAGIRYFDDWAATFGSVITAMELSADGRSFKARSKFARFQNVPELMRMFRAFADVKTAADLNLDRPELEGGKPIVITVPGSEKLDEVVKDLMGRAEEVRTGRVNPADDNMLKITSEGRKAATDLRLLDKEIKDEQESKINIAVKQMLMEYRAGQDGKLTQMAFLDMYRSMDEKENELINLYKDMKRKLVAGGVAENEIAIIGNYNTRAKRQALFEEVNAGKVRILLGSTQKMGAGTNAQKRLKALHHIDLTWRPGDLTQREGRILRQGNTNKSVRIYNYLTERSFDAYMAQTLQSKAEFLSQMLSGRSASRTMTDAAADMVMSLEEMKVAASGNPDIKKKYDLEMRLAQLHTIERSFEAQKRDARWQVQNIKSGIHSAEKNIARLEKGKAAIDKVKGEDGKGYALELDGRKFDNRKDAMEYAAAMNMPGGAFWMKLNGVDVMVDPTKKGRELQGTGDAAKYVEVPAAEYKLGYEDWPHNSPDYTVESILLSAESRFRKITDAIDSQQRYIKDQEDQLPKFEKLAARTDFPESKEIEKVRAELKEVEGRLGLGKVNEGSQAAGEQTAAVVDGKDDPAVEDKEEPDDDEEDGPDVTPGDTPPTKPEPPSDLGSQFYAGFADPALFVRLFPDVAERIKEWAGDDTTPGDEQRAMMRETRGRMDRRVAIAIFKLRDAAKDWRTRPRQDSIDFWNAVEEGRIGSLSPKDQALAQVFKLAFDKIRTQIQVLKPEALQNYIENYFPHIWENSASVRKSITSLLTGKKPFAGKGGFLKRRTIPTMQDGLDMGFTPKSWNPVDLFLLKYAEMAQFLMGHQTLEVMKQSGTTTFVKVGQKAPPGMAQLDDKIATVYRRVKVLDDDKLEDVTQPLTYPGGKRKIPGAFSEDIEDATHGELALVGHYYAPADAAKVFNNFVSRGIAGRSAIYDTLRWINDNLNGLQLGISAFHATVTTVNAAASDIALGIEQLMQGKPVKSGTSLLRGATVLPTLWNTIRNGSKLMREYLNPGSNAAMAKEAAALAQAGGRLTQNTIEIKPLDKAINAFRNGSFAEGLSTVPGAILQSLVAPVMEFYVPRMKVGAFYAMAHNILEEAQRKNWTPDLTRERMQEAWDSVDDRFGQVVYDNLFWHKGVRDALHLTLRAVGYTFGDVRTYAGAVKDTAKAAVHVARGKPKKARVTPRMAFAVGSFLSTALLGGVMHLAGTGHAPQTWKDYLYPKDAAGTRHTMPGYPDQIVNFAHDPVQGSLNKMAPIWTALGEVAKNRDFYGTEIRHKDDSPLKQLAEVGEWAAKQAIPFSFTNAGKLLEERGAMGNLGSMLHEAEEHPGDIALGQLGFTSAPSYIQHSAALNKAYEYERENMPPGTKTQEQAKHQQAVHALRRMFASGKVDRETIHNLKAQGLVKESDIMKARLQAKTDPLTHAFKSLSAEQALNVWNVADEKERKELRPEMELKQRELWTKVTDKKKREELREKYREALHPNAQLKPGTA